ncbi:hypothetical protein COX00_01850 [Candidatus Uhrbacteria bacterium CG22_combo_CG10-13_8_21_14_all_47_17]|uniref:Sporulation stage II protein D amidase enhancer LytB N-terminal domain-containing protein n=1 Tax=Candidatus Uhrbacteria bacterium CG22_combo_CG10-13_8_21_14_all_47_17 TaxID=1975041 RepID=A0A2H0BSM8_9BACT|nr:MAG: hypothetical protein COX00_01850 [Candidatus Uhrbacteria bacterium CG22_combo_CG10-13_8_21_14_all_47_17]
MVGYSCEALMQIASFFGRKAGKLSLSRFRNTLAVLLIAASFVSLLPKQAFALTRSDFQASATSLTFSRQLKPGATGTVSVGFKNIGSAYWSNSGSYYVSVYHFNPTAHIESDSPFATSNWVTKEQAEKLPVSRVNPGETTQFTFSIKAPSTPGVYHEEYVLVAESIARMSGGRFSFDIVVGDTAAQTSVQTASTVSSSSSSAGSAVASSIPQPKPNSRWSAELVSLGGTQWQLNPDQNVFVIARFKNTGSETWRNSGTSYASVYSTAGTTSERASPFRTALWMSNSHAVKLTETEVKPGQIGSFKIEIRAPNAPGNYNEQFTLAAEDTAWMANGAFSLPIVVPGTPQVAAATQPSSASTATTAATEQALAAASGYKATLLLRSAQSIQVSGNESQQMILGFKNEGAQTWKQFYVKLVGVAGATASLASFRDPSWVDASLPVKVTSDTKMGEIGFVTFNVKGPARVGNYTASFQLYADDQPVDGGWIDIPVTVTSDGVFETSPSVPSSASVANLPDEPMIRVGLFETNDNRMVVRAKYAPVSVILNGVSVCHLAVGQESAVAFNRTTNMYVLSGGPCSSQSAGVFRFHADDDISPMELADFSRPVSWLPGANDNTFRRQLELRYVADTGNVWVINELPMEAYLHGIGETSDLSPLEYQKALLTAARTYAMYHYTHNTKHGGVFHVDARYDQVYRGYGSETRSPKIVQAVDETRGHIVTYNGSLAITPYFSRSDGRTRSWGEVWYGGSNYPWLVSVPVPWDAAKNRTLWGHGVGMSATGALDAANDGWDWQRILRYFYTGIELTQVYK